MGRVGIRTRFLSAHKRAFNSTPIARRVGISTFDYACKPLSVENSEPPAESGNVAWQVVVPPILFQSVICLGTLLFRLRVLEHTARCSPLRQDCVFALAKKQSTCLALGWTFTQPLPSLAMLVGFYPTVSPLSCAALACLPGGILFCCSCRCFEFTPENTLTCCFVRQLYIAG